MDETKNNMADPANPAENINTGQQAEANSALQDSIDILKTIDSHWKEKVSQIYQNKLKLTDPLLARVNNLRQAIRFYLIPALQDAMKLPPERQDQFIRHLPFLFTEEQILAFLKHFYAMAKDEKDGWRLIGRDAYWIDELILYDLYKVKRTMRGINETLKMMKQSRLQFNASFSKDQQIAILQNMNSALFMTFKMSIKPEYQVEIFKNINLDYLYEDRIKERKRQQIVYNRENDLESSPYRRVFLHILLRNTIKTKIKGKETVISYSLIDFQQLLEEYFASGLDDPRTDPQILQIYHNFHMKGQSFAHCIINEPDQESLLLEDIDEIKTFI